MPPSDAKVSHEFTLSLPKSELHAHLSGSISRTTLHQIWTSQLTTTPTHPEPHHPSGLADPILALPQPGCTTSITIQTFFPLFDQYIYALITDISSLKLATRSVLHDFRSDGVSLLELRTTPRSSPHMTPVQYVQAITDVLTTWNREAEGQKDSSSSDSSSIVSNTTMKVFLILSINRKMSPKEANHVVDLAISTNFHTHHTPNSPTQGWTVGVDLCGDPSVGRVETFSSSFARAKASGLGITVHFAEVKKKKKKSSSSSIFGCLEQETLLSWWPDRLGHAIHVEKDVGDVLRSRGVCLELCLSCNVLAKMTEGGLGKHHFGMWWLGLAREDDVVDEKRGGGGGGLGGGGRKGVKVALGTDDVGVFGSPLSREYLLAAEHFGLDRRGLLELCRSAASAAFAGKERMMALIDKFEEDHLCG